MSASVLHAQRSLQEPETALLTGKHLGSAGNNGICPPSSSSSAQKRGSTVLPSIERERCLSCNSTIRDSGASTSGPVVNKNPFQMAPVYGGGFQLPGPASVDKSSSLRASNSTGGSRDLLSPRTPLGSGPGLLQPGNARSSLTESASEGQVALAYGPRVVTFKRLTRLWLRLGAAFCSESTDTCTRATRS